MKEATTARKIELENEIAHLNVQHSVETEALENRITKQEESYTALQVEKKKLTAEALVNKADNFPEENFAELATLKSKLAEKEE